MESPWFSRRTAVETYACPCVVNTIWRYSTPIRRAGVWESVPTLSWRRQVSKSASLRARLQNPIATTSVKSLMRRENVPSRAERKKKKNPAHSHSAERLRVSRFLSLAGTKSLFGTRRIKKARNNRRAISSAGKCPGVVTLGGTCVLRMWDILRETWLLTRVKRESVM